MRVVQPQIYTIAATEASEKIEDLANPLFVTSLPHKIGKFAIAGRFLCMPQEWGRVVEIEFGVIDPDDQKVVAVTFNDSFKAISKQDFDKGNYWLRMQCGEWVFDKQGEYKFLIWVNGKKMSQVVVHVKLSNAIKETCPV